MNNLKYVVVTVEEEPKEFIFVFPSYIDHDKFVEGLGAMRVGHPWERKFHQAVSAGFITNGVCHGHSETLGLKSRGTDDTHLLNRR